MLRCDPTMAQRCCSDSICYSSTQSALCCTVGHSNFGEQSSGFLDCQKESEASSNRYQHIMFDVKTEKGLKTAKHYVMNLEFAVYENMCILHPSLYLC